MQRDAINCIVLGSVLPRLDECQKYQTEVHHNFIFATVNNYEIVNIFS